MANHQCACTFFRLPGLNRERMTWGHASLLPKALIDEFEGGNVVKEVITDHCYGVVNHTLVVKSSATESDNPQRK